MNKILPYALAIGIITTGFVSTTAVTEVSAASSYKLVKNKLVHSKTGKTVKNHAIYKKKLYKNGKLVTKTTVYKKLLFKKGKLVTKSTVYNNQLFKKGKLVTKSTVYNNQLFHKGKLVTKSTVYNNQLFHKGKLVTKSTVYNNQLFHKGKLATGNVLHNKTLYVNGKISNDIVKHNNQFYKAGNRVSSNFNFLYKGTVYKGNKVDKNFKFVEGYLEYKGDHYFGLIDKTYFEYGVDYSETTSNANFYSNTGTTMTTEIHLHSEGKLNYNKKDFTINNGATIKSVKYVKAAKYRSPKIVISLSNTKMNTNYTITIKNATVDQSKPFTFKHQFSGLTSKTLASKDYKVLKKFYDKYKNLSAAEYYADDTNDGLYEQIMRTFDRATTVNNAQSAEFHAEYNLAIHLFDQFNMTSEF